MKKKLSAIISIVLCIQMLFGIAAMAAQKNIPSPSSGNPIICYTIASSGKVYAYKESGLKNKTGGYIACSTDECKIVSVSGNAVKVTYPISGGTRTAWFKRSEFTNYNLSGKAEQWKQSKKITTYRRSDGKTSFGYVSANDVCYKLNASGSYTQIIYPVSGGDYKMGWVKTSDIKSGGSNNSDKKDDNKSSNKYQAELDKMISGTSYNGTYKVGTKYTGPDANEQCKGFAKNVHKNLFGYLIGSTKSKPNNYQINISSSNTKLVGSVTNMGSKKDADVKAVFSKARPGDFVQIRRTHSGSHSAIVYSVSSSGITFYEANLDGKNTIYKKTYKWSDLRDKNEAMSLYTAKNY